MEKDLARLEKSKDKELSPDNVIVVCYDMQAVFQCPRGDVSVFYYKSKLNIYNLTFYDLKSKDVTCFVWHEGEAERGVNEIGSCVLMFIEKEVSKRNGDIEFIFYTDNCAGQQKNKFMPCLYQYAIRKYPTIKSITHKFLIRGHTQNEGDSVNSAIEREVKQQLKKGSMYLPDDFIDSIRAARKRGRPYKVVELNHTSFFNIKNLLTNDKNFSKTIANEDVKFNDIKCYRITRENSDKMFLRMSYQEDKFQEIDTRKETRNTRNKKKQTCLKEPETLKPAYRIKRQLPENKKKDLLELLNNNFIPKRCEIHKK